MTERRSEQRLRTLRSGKIWFNGRRSVIDCLIRNLSTGGTCLRVENTLGIPPTFDLLLDGEETTRPCRAVWMSENRIGVEFCDAEAAPGADLSPPGAVEAKKAPDQPATPIRQPPPVQQPASDQTLVRSELISLRAALDNVPIGIVLLDSETRAQFINRAFRKMWRLPDAKAESKPPFVALVYHGRDTHAYSVPSGDLGAYVEIRVAHVKAGNPKPLDIRCRSGEVIRMQCTCLPNGGRMLCYTFVTDIVSRADELETLRGALDEIDQGIILLDPLLNAQFLNRAVRKLWKISDEQAERKPPYVELLSDAPNTGAFAVPAEEFEKFVAARLALARAGDPTPMDLPHTDGRVIRAQCTALPSGGRMLTYSDVTDLVHRAAQFEELATIDSLTGVNNRRQFNALATGEWSRFQRYYRPLSILLLDIDLFKQINDRYGHEVGDRAIVHVAMACKASRRSSDILCRLGGDEFVILLPETTLAQAHVFAERLRHTISHRPMRSYDENGDDVLIQASIGIAEATASMASIDALMKLADAALYRAKTAGRNCTMAISPPTLNDDRAAAE